MSKPDGSSPADAIAVDLRSDTVTAPTPGMREAMAKARVGDDVLGDDPTVNALQERVAAMFGKEAGCFVPSGTMANVTAIRAQTQAGDEVIGHESAHFYQYESGGFAAMCGCSVKLLNGARGMFTPEAMLAGMRVRNDHFPHSRLVIIENTSNRGGGSIWPMDLIERVSDAAHEHDLRMHLDGARVWNACVATGYQPEEYGRHFDTISTCFSKGLGAPVGSMVVGDRGTIARVRRFRKMFGGTMRQSGVLAAAALYAIEHHMQRLAEDHAKAIQFAQGMARLTGVTLDPAEVETNIVYFDLDSAWGTAAEFSAALDRGLNGVRVRMFPTGPQRLRAVMHLDVSSAQVDLGLEVIRDVLAKGGGSGGGGRAVTGRGTTAAVAASGSGVRR